MGMAFEITEDDVEGVLRKHLKNVSPELVEQAFDEIDHDQVEDSALSGEDMDEQLEYALNDIEEQLKALGFI